MEQAAILVTPDPWVEQSFTTLQVRLTGKISVLDLVSWCACAESDKSCGRVVSRKRDIIMKKEVFFVWHFMRGMQELSKYHTFVIC